MRRKAERPVSRSRRRWPRRAAMGLLAILVLAGGAWAAWRHETMWPKIAAGATKAIFVVPPGASADAIARQLYGLGLVRHPLVFRLLARERGLETQLKAGEYALSGPLSLEGILDALARGDVVRRDVTIPEGRNLDEVAALVVAQGMESTAFLEAARDPAPVRDLDPAATDLEGYLFPDTYEVPRSPEAPRVLVRRMTQRFREIITPELGRIAEKGLTVRQAVTLASIVELETASAEERPRIAEVFLNRLGKGMPLQTDPSVVYALKKAGRWDGNIRKRDLDIDSPYNTYRRPGLPPGPLASPGRDAIRAVLDPSDTRELYFVSRNDGTHEFSQTLADHNRAVNRYQRRRASS
ncbi:MAG TPA: endolytic transglycosylase MltG [Vicinamibacteria bacterium]|nr:endolytic transglycosylase MltG [Vicinamibacteria bacterium]